MRKSSSHIALCPPVPVRMCSRSTLHPARSCLAMPSPEVLGALVLSVCDQLIRAAVEAGAFPNAKVPLTLLAGSLLPDFVHMESKRCGHA